MAKKIKKVFSKHHKGLGCGFLSWERLIKRLRQSGELRSQDKIVKIEVDDDGIKYTTRTKPKNKR